MSAFRHPMARVVNTIVLTSLLSSGLCAVTVPFEPPAGPVMPAAAGEVPPRTWPAQAFRPLTADRIAELPDAEQRAWRSYLQESARRAQLIGSRHQADRPPSQPGGPTIGSTYSKGLRHRAPAAYYGTEDARSIADHVVTWQTAAGGWSKGGDYSRPRQASDDQHSVWSAGTFDNNATTAELRYLARVVAAASSSPRREAWQAALLRGVEYILAAQYPNGGYPQIYPLAGGYHDAVTFNDNAMVHILELLLAITRTTDGFASLPAPVVDRAREQSERGLRCVLAAQLRSPSGRRWIWPQQCDALTLQPCAARNFEPVATSSSESAGLLKFLLSLPTPTPEVASAIEGAAAWFEANALTDVRWDRAESSGTGLTASAGAPTLWARYHELETGRPVFGERDRTVRYAVTELSDERRLGYAWFHTQGSDVLEAYAAWKKRRAND